LEGATIMPGGTEHPKELHESTRAKIYGHVAARRIECAKASTPAWSIGEHRLFMLYR
jgi:hypothetical protein